jgi:suppressor for copper-sensitivity B
MKNILATLITLTLLNVYVYPAMATPNTFDWQKTEQTEVRLIAATNSTGTNGTIRLGIHFRLKPKWKIYWRSPGDAGFPPELKWDGSTNLKSAVIQWPAPKRFSVLGIETLGYEDEVVLPILAIQQTKNIATTFKAQLRYLTCNDICIPNELSFILHLQAGNGEPSQFTHLINSYQSQVPVKSSKHGLKIVSSRTTETPNKAKIQLALESATPLSQPDAYFEGPTELTFTKPKITMATDQHSAILEVNVDGLKFLEGKPGKTVKGRTFTITLIDGKRGVEQRVTIGNPALNTTTHARPTSSYQVGSILYIMVLAVFGGLILNLMPCVLPVLSIKILGIISHAGAEKKTVRLNFLASAMGIITSFLTLASILIGLKSAGIAIGWGIQFQYPWFIIAMIILVILFACNLWGLFEFRLPNILAQLGSPSQNNNHLSSHFLQGALVTLLATPCSAPFLGTAVGFALARGSSEIFLIFLALGFGLALPFLIFTIFPSMVTCLPRPGAWMLRLRILLGFALVATAAWLIKVLSSSLGSTGAGSVAAIALCIIVVLYYCHTQQKEIRKGAWIPITTLIITAFILPNLIYPSLDTPPNIINSKVGPIHWKRFDLAAIPSLITQGKTVLVDVTADWCITCKVNKTLVFGKGTVADLMDKSEVIAMQANWTRPDFAITEYLSSFGRYGIPFNIVYGPNSPKGIVLPELLTKSVVLSALRTASLDSGTAIQKN